jgi:hypothetical protein
MKPYSLFLLLLALLCWTGCDDEDANTLTTLNYDGPNFTAPQLQAGKTTFAAYFPPGRTEVYDGRDLERVSFYVSAIPQSTRVVIYEEGADDFNPGDIVYQRDISARVNQTGWYEDRLPTPIPITGQGLWLTVEVEVGSDNPFALGCDAGNNYNSNGDLIRAGNTLEFTNYRNLTPETVNWNIRGIISNE